MTPRKPTIDDVARHAGVARTTVSRVLNGGPNVRTEVRDRVLQSVAALDYRVNAQARSLAGGGSRLLAMIFVSDLEAEPNSFYHSALELGALRGCLERGYQLLTRHIPDQGPDARRQVLELIASQRCEGLILTPPYSDDAALIEAALKRGCRVATISPGGAGVGLADGVGMDDEAGGHDIGRRLIALGHRRLGFMGGIEGHLSAERRLDGLTRAMREAGLDPAGLITVRGDFTFRSGRELAGALLDGEARPTALACANDDMAAGALAAAHARGLSAPGDISITGFDDTPVSAIVWPPLTTVHQPLKDMGRQAVIALAERLTGARTDPAPRFDLLAHELIARQSDGAPRAGEDRRRGSAGA